MNYEFLKDPQFNGGGTLIILCGPPGCGKSTLATELSKLLDNSVIISPDSIREEYYGDASDQTHNRAVFSIVYSRLKEELSLGKTVIYDATNCRAIHRNKIIKICREYTYRIICMVSTASLETCFINNNARERVVPTTVIEKMYLNLKKNPPTIFEGYDLIVRF